MSVTHFFRKIKRIYWIIILITIGITVGHLSYIYDKFNYSEDIIFLDNYNGIEIKEDFEVYASKTGTKYYYAWCGGLNRIKIGNRVSFSNKNDAEATGLEKAKNCHGR